MIIVYDDGCSWRYDFNAKKRGILVYDEIIVLKGDYDMLAALIRKPKPGLNSSQMDATCVISVRYVHEMYTSNF